MQYCQSCGMPLNSEDQFGTEQSGAKSEDYCAYCYKDGAFLQECTMDEMIEGCIPFISNNNPYPDAESAKKAMQDLFPNLKRWKKA